MNPRELALQLLRCRFGVPDPADSAALRGLAGFQRAAVPRLERALQRYGGALLADSVGLGKTYVGAALARRELARGGDVACIVPSALLRQWRRALPGADHVTFATHAQLSRGGAPMRVQRATLLLVDEAHAFRNPHARRYAALARLTSGRRVLLITATPVNNSLRDLYWLLRLFATDDAFIDVGVPGLLGCLREAERTGRFARVPTILAEVAVRRTRAEVMAETSPAAAPAPALRFPEREPPREVPYAVQPELVRALLDCVDSLTLAPWSEFGSTASALLLRLVLLKRLESSRAAFIASLTRLQHTLRAFYSALLEGRLLTPAEQRVRRAQAADQLVLEPLVLRPLPRVLDAAAIERAACADLHAIEHSLRMLSGEDADPKLCGLHRLLLDQLRDRPVLVFTEFRETAEHLWRALLPHAPTALIHGSGSFLGSTQAARRLVVERFAPRSNGVRPPPERERVRVLVATDVLAEGLNLQDAADLVSYDLPWNPVRLLQRMGRIDRLGSPHTSVRSYYFAPDTELDSMLRLLGRIRAKLAAIRGSVGEDATVLTEAGAPAASAPARGPTDRLFELEARLRAALAAAEPTGSDALAGLPLASEVPHAGNAFSAGDVLHEADVPPPAARRSAARSRAPDPTVACALLPRPASPAFAHIDAVVFLECKRRQRAVCLGNRRPLEDDRLAAEVLLAALAGGTTDRAAAAPDPATIARLADRAIRCISRPPPTRRRPGYVRELRARLLQLLGQRPGGPTDAECRRAELLLELLAAPASVAAELALRAAAARSRAAHWDFDTLAAAIDRCLEEGTSPAIPGSPAPLAPAGRPRASGTRPAMSLQGVFLLVPA